MTTRILAKGTCLTTRAVSNVPNRPNSLCNIRYHRPGSVEVVGHGILASAVAKGASRSCLEKEKKFWYPTHGLMFYIYLHILILDQTNLVERLMAVRSGRSPTDNRRSNRELSEQDGGESLMLLRMTMIVKVMMVIMLRMYN